MTNLQQVSFSLDLDNPADPPGCLWHKETWEALQPLIQSGEANALLCRAARQALGLDVTLGFSRGVAEPMMLSQGVSHSIGHGVNSSTVSHGVTDCEGWGVSHSEGWGHSHSVTRADPPDSADADSDGLPPPPIS